MTVQNTAESAILGFAYQWLYGLYLMVYSDEEKKLHVEYYDDLTLVKKGTNRIIQTKSSKPGKTITDSSEDLWKTLRNWSNLLLTKKLELSNTEFIIITTKHAPEDTAAYFLKPAINKPQKALETLMKYIENSDSNIKKKYYPLFRKLGTRRQIELLKKISVLDNAPTSEQIEKNIKYFFQKFTDVDFIDKYYDHLCGWWENKIKQALETEKREISSKEFNKIIKNLADVYHKKLFSGTITESDARSQITKSNKKTYVKQLLIIDKSPSIIKEAKIDYVMTQLQNSEWLEENPSLDPKIKKHRHMLYRQWKIKFGLETEGLTEKTGKPKLTSVGSEIFRWAMLDTGDLDISDDIEPFHRHGTFHELSDMEEIGWHPFYKDELKREING